MQLNANQDDTGETKEEMQNRIIEDPNIERQNIAIIITKEADFKFLELLVIKLSKFNGVAVKCKSLTP